MLSLQTSPQTDFTLVLFSMVAGKGVRFLPEGKSYIKKVVGGLR